MDYKKVASIKTFIAFKLEKKENLIVDDRRVETPIALKKRNGEF
jgi:hypothetical protein